MTVTFIGQTTHEDVLKHPRGFAFVTLDGATYMRTDNEPVWRQIKDAKTDEITIATQAQE